MHYNSAWVDFLSQNNLSLRRKLSISFLYLLVSYVMYGILKTPMWMFWCNLCRKHLFYSLNLVSFFTTRHPLPKENLKCKRIYKVNKSLEYSIKYNQPNVREFLIIFQPQWFFTFKLKRSKVWYCYGEFTFQFWKNCPVKKKKIHTESTLKNC